MTTDTGPYLRAARSVAWKSVCSKVSSIVSVEERYRTKLGDEVYDEADAWQMGRTPVVNDSPMLTPDARVRRPRDPLRPAGIDYQEYAPTPTPTPKKKRVAP